MIICKCGAEVDTKFCPECGQQASHYDLDGLVVHCKKYVREAEKRVRYLSDIDDLDAIRRHNIPDKIKRAKMQIGKWGGWIDLLNAIKRSDHAQEILQRTEDAAGGG